MRIYLHFEEVRLLHWPAFIIVLSRLRVNSPRRCTVQK